MFIICLQMNICHLHCVSCQNNSLCLKPPKGKCTCVMLSCVSAHWWSTASKSYWIKKFCVRKGKRKTSPLCGISIMIFFSLHLCCFNRGPRLISERLFSIFLHTSSFSLNVPVGAPHTVHCISRLAKREQIHFAGILLHRVFEMQCKSAGQGVSRTH